MVYYAKIVKDNKEGGYLVTFPDFCNIFTEGETIIEAIKHAGEALNGVLESNFERSIKIPEPAEFKSSNYYPIEVEPNIAFTYKLRELRGKLTQKVLANKLGITYQAYQKLEHPVKCNPTIKTLNKLAKALDKKLEIELK